MHNALTLTFECSIVRHDPIPDPVKLLRRMAALESRIDQLKRDAVNVAHGRKDLALSITDIQLKNAHLLQKVCYHAE
jgi:hypothetical protein